MSHLGLSARWHGQNIVATVLAAVYYFSPVVLLFFFLVAFTIRSVRASSPPTVEELNNGPTVSEILIGPGGKPLPQRKLTGLQRRRDKANDFSLPRKLVFQWLSIGATSTFLCSAAAVITHVLNEHQWWCGDQLVVRPTDMQSSTCLASSANHLIFLSPRFISWDPSLYIRCSPCH
jgi:ATP-binding cassette, subfamily B, vacuolar membrane transporter HMT1/ACLQ